MFCYLRNKIKEESVWHKWFAWYPVSTMTPDGDYKIIWFKYIFRRRDCNCWPNNYWIWEYTEETGLSQGRFIFAGQYIGCWDENKIEVFEGDISERKKYLLRNIRLINAEIKQSIIYREKMKIELKNILKQKKRKSHVEF